MKKIILFFAIFYINSMSLFAGDKFNEKTALNDWNKFVDCVEANIPYKNDSFAMSYCFCLYSYSARNNDFSVIDEVIEKFNEATITGNLDVEFTNKTKELKTICSTYK